MCDLFSKTNVHLSFLFFYLLLRYLLRISLRWLISLSSYIRCLVLIITNRCYSQCFVLKNTFSNSVKFLKHCLRKLRPQRKYFFARDNNVLINSYVLFSFRSIYRYRKKEHVHVRLCILCVISCYDFQFYSFYSPVCSKIMCDFEFKNVVV